MRTMIIAALIGVFALGPAALGASAQAQERGGRHSGGGYERGGSFSGYGHSPYGRGPAGSGPEGRGPGGFAGYPGGGRSEPPVRFSGGGPYGGGPGYGGGYPGAGGYGGSRGAYGEPRGAYGGGGAFRRGQVLPQGYWGGMVANPRIYHLRRPPNGYGWVTVGPNAYLMQRSTGLILDTAPLY